MAGPRSVTGTDPIDVKRPEDEVKVDEKTGHGQGVVDVTKQTGENVTANALADAARGLASLGLSGGKFAEPAKIKVKKLGEQLIDEPVLDQIDRVNVGNRESIKMNGDTQISLINRIGVPGVNLFVKNLGAGRVQIGFKKSPNITAIHVGMNRYDPAKQEIGDRINLVDNKIFSLENAGAQIFVNDAFVLEHGVGAFVTVQYINGRHYQFSVVVTEGGKTIKMRREDVSGEDNGPLPPLVQAPKVSGALNQSSFDSDLMFPDHKLKSAEEGSRIYDHLLVQAAGNAVGLGSLIHLGAEDVFVSPASLISVAEAIIYGAYQGTVQTPFTLQPRAIGRDETLRMTPLKSGEVEVGVPVGISEPGKRVVVRLESSREPLGRDTVVALEGQQAMQVKRKVGGRDEIVNIVNGKTVPTNVLYVVGGPYGSTGEFGIYTIFAGTYVPPASDQVYWGAHAFVTGDTSFVRNDQGGFEIVPDSNLAKMIERGELALLP